MASHSDGRAGKPSRLWAMVRQRCPRCLTGQVFAGMFRMRETCPRCGFKYGREEGYFSGAMYISYMIGMLAVFGIFLVMWAFSSRTLTAAYVLIGITAVLYIPLVPLVFRYSRVVWMHLDRRFGPERAQDRPKRRGDRAAR